MLTLAVLGYASGGVSDRVVAGGRLLRSVVVGLLAASGVGLFVILSSLLKLEAVTEESTAVIVAVVGVSSMVLNPLVEPAVRWGLLMRPNFAGTPA